MSLLQEQEIYCPYCGEAISMLIDCSILEQSYVEDCQVCCQPILLNIAIDDQGNPNVSCCQENQ